MGNEKHLLHRPLVREPPPPTSTTWDVEVGNGLAHEQKFKSEATSELNLTMVS